MVKLKFLVSLLLAPCLAGCAELGMKSVPWPTNVEVHDAEAMNFLRGPARIDADLGAGLEAKEMFADGRLVGLSVSGGGARAAAFTLGVLTELQAIKAGGSTALDSLDFISSNSGGSWGVAAYLSDRAARDDPGYSLLSRMLGPPGGSLIERFDRISDGRVPCWSVAMRKHLFGRQTYGDVYSPRNRVRLPRAYINAALLPSHSPFVFTDAFLKHYRVNRFGACGGDWMSPEESTAIRTLADLPLGYAAAASGTVPPFYYAYARTGLCGEARLEAEPSFCHRIQKGKARDFLRIADGGYYDNIGYKTAYEVMLSQKDESPQARRAMILVNSNPATELQTIKRGDRSSSFLATTALNGLFAVQDSTFDRLHGAMFVPLGVEKPVLLDFYSTAGFRPDQHHLLTDLEELAYYAAYNVRCYDGSTLLPVDRNKPRDRSQASAGSVDHLVRKGGDCLSENFYRTGTLGKTTYKIDGPWFRILWQLGRLSVRMKCPAIVEALDGNEGSDACAIYRQGATASRARRGDSDRTG